MFYQVLFNTQGLKWGMVFFPKFFFIEISIFPFWWVNIFPCNNKMLFLCCVYSLTSIRVKCINCLRIWCTLNLHKNASVWFLPRGHLPSASLSRALTPGWFSQFLQKGFSKNSNNPGVVNFHGLVELIKEIEYWLKNNIWRWILYWYGLEITFHLIQETESQKFLHINTFFLCILDACILSIY